MSRSTHSGRIAPRITMLVRWSIGPGMPMPAPMSWLRLVSVRSQRASSIRAATSMLASTWWPTSSAVNSSSSSRNPDLARTTLTWLRPKSMPTATSASSRTVTPSARRPELVVGVVVTRPVDTRDLTMLEIVAVERPVERAKAACVSVPWVRSVARMRCSLSPRRAACDPGFWIPALAC